MFCCTAERLETHRLLEKMLSLYEILSKRILRCAIKGSLSYYTISVAFVSICLHIFMEL